MHVDISTWCRYIYIDDVDLSQADVDISTSDVDISTRKEKGERKRRRSTRRITSCCLLIMMILSWTVSGQTFSFTSTGEEKERMEGEENEKGEEKEKRRIRGWANCVSRMPQSSWWGHIMHCGWRWLNEPELYFTMIIEHYSSWRDDTWDRWTDRRWMDR